MYGRNLLSSLEANMKSDKTKYNIKDLKEFDDIICGIAKKYGLEWFPINYEICDYYEMIGHMAYHGMPSHYNHWSYGKSFERTHLMYNMGQSGLPYELIINSDPSIAYLMMQNDFYLQVLINIYLLNILWESHHYQITLHTLFQQIVMRDKLF